MSGGWKETKPSAAILEDGCECCWMVVKELALWERYAEQEGYPKTTWVCKVCQHAPFTKVYQYPRSIPPEIAILLGAIAVQTHILLEAQGKGV